jgi:hypothetical protein
MWDHVKKLRRYLEQNGLFQKARASQALLEEGT